MDITFPEGELRGLYYLVAKDIFAFAVCFAISSLEAGAPWMKSVNSFPFSPMWGNTFAESIRCCMILPNNWCLLTVMIALLSVVSTANSLIFGRHLCLAILYTTFA